MVSSALGAHYVAKATSPRGYRKAHKLWFDNSHASDLLRVKDQRKDALRSRELHYQIGALDNLKNLPAFMGKLKIDWLDFPVDDILQQFTTLKDGILRGFLSSKLLALGMAVVLRKLK